MINESVVVKSGYVIFLKILLAEVSIYTETRLGTV